MKETFAEEKYMPYPFCENHEFNNRVYGQIYLEEFTVWENGGGIIRINASLVNDQMIDIEFGALDTNDTPLFFYEFTGETTFAQYRDIVKYSVIRRFRNNEYYSISLLNLDETGTDEELIIQEYKNKMVFVGNIIFSASPILSHKAAIVVEELTKDIDKLAYEKMKKTYEHWDNEIKKKCICDRNKIEKELQVLFDKNVMCKSVNLYNVGQANCCYCDLDTKKLFFDIGITRSKEDRESLLVKKAIQEIANLEVDAVILSHWDLDHILGVCYNNSCLDQKIWLVPDFGKLYSVPRISIKRLCNYLLNNGKSKVMMVDTSEARKVLFESVNKAISVYLGEPKDAYGINKMNNGGLILKLENQKNILMPGDCENSIIPYEAIKDELDNILISHHGSNMSEPKMNGRKGNSNRAYISCGNKSGNCKIDDEIRKKYKERGFENVRYTKNLKKHSKYRIVL